jgi:hypothetical protein
LLADAPTKTVKPNALVSGTAVRTFENFRTLTRWDHFRVRVAVWHTGGFLNVTGQRVKSIVCSERKFRRGQREKKRKRGSSVIESNMILFPKPRLTRSVIRWSQWFIFAVRI